MKNHDYAAPEIGARMPAEAVARGQLVGKIEALSPLRIALASDGAEVDIAKNAVFKPLVQLLPAQGKQQTAFSSSYLLGRGRHLLRVRDNAGELFRIQLIIHAAGADDGDADAADLEWDNKLDAIARTASRLEDIASPAFLQNHVVAESEVAKLGPASAMAAGAELASALRSIFRGKATTLIVLDAGSRAALFNEVIARSKANEYSSSGTFVSRQSYRTFNLDPVRKVFQELDAAFHYSLYHDRDGLWRISHYEQVDAGGRLVSERPAGVLISTTDHGQTDEQKAHAREWKASLDNDQSRLDDINKRLAETPDKLKNATESLVKPRARVAELQQQIDDYPSYERAFKIDHPIRSHGDIKLDIARLQAAVDKENLLLEKTAKPAVSSAEKTFEGLSKQAVEPEHAEAHAEQLKQAEKQLADALAERKRVAQILADMRRELTDLQKLDKNYAKYVQDNTPVPLDKLQETLAFIRAQVGKLEAAEAEARIEVQKAEDDRDWEAEDLPGRIRLAQHMVDNAPTRHDDWIARLRVLMEETDRKARRAAADAWKMGDKLPADWKDRVTPK